MVESFGASIGLQAALFGSGILLARTLGPADRGDLALVFILPEVAMQLGCTGVPSAVTYFVAREPRAVTPLARSLLPVILAQLGAMALLLLVLVDLFLGAGGASSRTAGFIMFAGLPFLILEYYASHALQGLGAIRAYNLDRLASPVLFTTGLAVGLLSGLTIITCTLLYLAARITTVLLTLVLLRARVRQTRAADPSTETPSRSTVLRFAVTGYLAQVSPIETFKLDTLIVASFFSPRIVGYYAVALSVSNAPRFIADAIVTVAYPQVAAQGAGSGRKLSKRYVLMAIALCGPVAVAIAAAVTFLIPFLFGAEFRPSVVIAVFLVLAAGLVSVRRVGVDCLRALGLPGASTATEVVTLAVLGGCVLLFGHWQEGRGVALSLLVAAAVGLALTVAVLLRTGRRKPTGGDVLSG